MRSCNPWFYHIGYTLWNDGYRTAIPDVAAGFGLGRKTGIEIPEFEGNLNMTPADVYDYVQMSIGQSTLQNSPPADRKLYRSDRQWRHLASTDRCSAYRTDWKRAGLCV